MDGSDKKWFEADSSEAERAFREMLVRLAAEKATDAVIAENVVKSPFILGLLLFVTCSEKAEWLRKATAGRPPENWEGWLAREGGRRDEWRCETVCVLAERLRKRKKRTKKETPENECDLDRPDMGGYWRIKVAYAAIKAAWNLHFESRLKVRGKKCCRIECHGDSYTDGPTASKVTPAAKDTNTLPEEGDPDLELDLKMSVENLSPPEGAVRRLSLLWRDNQEMARLFPEELRVDLAMVVDGLENPRQRAVLRLWLMGYTTYDQITQALVREPSADEKRMTRDKVIYAFRKGIENLQKRLLPPAA